MFSLLWTSNHKLKCWKSPFFALGTLNGFLEGNSSVTNRQRYKRHLPQTVFCVLFQPYERTPSRNAAMIKSAECSSSSSAGHVTKSPPHRERAIWWLICPNIALIENAIPARHIGLTQTYAHAQTRMNKNKHYTRQVLHAHNFFFNFFVCFTVGLLFCSLVGFLHVAFWKNPFYSTTKSLSTA